jgi:hypothetical protein
MLLGIKGSNPNDFSNERELLYKVLFDMRKDVIDLKKAVAELMCEHEGEPVKSNEQQTVSPLATLIPQHIDNDARPVHHFESDDERKRRRSRRLQVARRDGKRDDCQSIK